MTTKVFVAELSEGEFVQTTFLAVEKEIRASRTGEPYLRVLLEDRTGRIEGRAWQDPDALGGRFETEDFVALRGEVTKYGDSIQLEIGDIDVVGESTIDPADYFPVSQWPPDAMFDQLRSLLDEHVQSDPIRAFLDALFADEKTTRQFCTAPAAMTNHHAYRGGLLEHCLSMCRVAVGLAEHYDAYYPGLVNRGLLLAGVILHDFAKVWELSYSRKFNYTSPGRLVGHIPMGSELVGRVASRSKRPISEDLQMHLQHLVLSHHGEMEYGAPITPKTAEAVLLHEVDMIDSRMNMLWNEHAATHDPDADESWTDYRRKFSGRILFRGKNSADWEITTTTRSEELTGPGLRDGRKPPRTDADLTLDLFDDGTK